jgi:hypothetical protein
MTIDYDDPAIEEQWCAERQAEVGAYLKREGVTHGRIGEWPAWHVAPYVSVWAIESAHHPEWVGWWVLCGDLPTDYVSADAIKHPRDAIFAIAQRWRDAAELMARGETHPEFTVGAQDSGKELAPLLKSRAATLIAWANDEQLWAADAL